MRYNNKCQDAPRHSLSLTDKAKEKEEKKYLKVGSIIMTTNEIITILILFLFFSLFLLLLLCIAAFLHKCVYTWEGREGVCIMFLSTLMCVHVSCVVMHEKKKRNETKKKNLQRQMMPRSDLYPCCFFSHFRRAYTYTREHVNINILLTSAPQGVVGVI